MPEAFTLISFNTLNRINMTQKDLYCFRYCLTVNGFQIYICTRPKKHNLPFTYIYMFVLPS